MRLKGLLLKCLAWLILGTVVGWYRPVQAADVTDFGAIAGDGKCDRAAIQAAIDAATHPNNEALGEVTFPAGVYNLSLPLFVGYDFIKYPQFDQLTHFGPSSATTRPGKRKPSVHLRGIGRACLRYIGPRTSNYLVYYTGTTNHGSPCITDLRLECYHKCRGLFAYHQAYGSRFTGLTVRQSRQVAVDAVACFGSSFDNLLTLYCRGIGFRGWEFNTSTARCWKINSSAYNHASVAKQAEFRLYLRDNGVDATRAEYGSDFIEDWPPTDETHIVDASGKPVQTSKRYRAAIVVAKSSQASFDTILLENLCQGDYPVISNAIHMGVWRHVRFEGNVALGTKMRIGPNAATSIEHVSVADTGLSDSVVEFDGPHERAMICNVRSNGTRQAIVVFRCTSGETWGNVMDNCHDVTGRAGSVLFDLQGGTQRDNRVDGYRTSPPAGTWTIKQ